MQRQKIKLDAVRACLDIVCTKCANKITPDKIQRIDSERVKCPACGEVFDANSGHKQISKVTIMYLYLRMFLYCNNQNCPTAHQLGDSFCLPYPDLPEVSEDQWSSGEYEHLLVSPSREWKGLFGCRECGHVDTYTDDHIGHRVLERTERVRLHGGTNYFSVRLQCSKLECRAPATLNVELRNGEAESDLLRLLRSSYFVGQLPCGHPIMKIPDCFYRDPHRLMNRLW